tara:strand:- start:518 stop:763 length:246 start_codon:yes stop_codon:yes gene_type:complete
MIYDRRFDIIWSSSAPDVQLHFCREWGCYGTNPDHGLTEHEVVKHMVKWHKEQIELWQSKKHPTYVYYMNDEVDDGVDNMD